MKLPIIKPNVDRYIDDLLPIMREIFESNMLTNVYNYTGKFETAVKEYIGIKHAVSVSNCTSGLILTLEALGVRNLKLIMPSFTFVATAAAAYWTNNKIVYSDIDGTFTLDTDQVNDKITQKTGAILAVHMYGNPVHIKELTEIASDNKIPLILDAAHALGSEYHGEKIGHFGAAEVFSLSPTKLITSVEGGMIVTDNDKLAEHLRVARNYGMFPDYTSDQPGLNARLSEVHGAVGLVHVKDLDKFVNNRNRYVDLYKDQLSKIKGIKFQEIPMGHLSSHKDFSIVVDPDQYGMNRDELGKIMESKGVAVKKYFYPPMHKLKAYQDKKVKLPITEYVSNNILSLPIYNYMDENDIKFICNIIKGN